MNINLKNMGFELQAFPLFPLYYNVKYVTIHPTEKIDLPLYSHSSAQYLAQANYIKYRFNQMSEWVVGWMNK